MDREIFFLATSIIFILLTFITVVFASTIIITLVCHWKSRCRTIANLLTCNSCVTLLYQALATTIEIAFVHVDVDTAEAHIPPTIFCRIRAFLYLSACSTITYSYLIQAISRYFITVLYQHRILLTFRTNWLLIVTSWILSILIAASMFTSPSAYQYEPESRMCLLTSKAFTPSFLGMTLAFCIPLQIIILLYALILRSATRQQRTSNTLVARRLRRNLKVFQTILIFVSIMTLGGMPFFLSVVINRIHRIPWPWYSLSILFISLSCALEAVALFFTNFQVKKLVRTRIHGQALSQNDSRTVAVMRKN